MAAQLNMFRIIGSSNIRNAFSTRLKLSERITGQSTEFVSAVAWMEAKLASVMAIMNDQTKDVANITLLPQFVALAKDFESDGVHLNRQTQSRLFNHILDAIFPGERSVKTKNISRSRSISEEDLASPPTKKINDQPGTSPTPEILTQNAPASLDVSLSLSEDGVVSQQAQPQSSLPTESNMECSGASNSIEALRNPDLQQLYDMLSRKMDSVKDSSTATQSKVQEVEARVITAVQQVERNTLMLRSLHLRTARQAEVLDAHSNSLNLNVVMISGVPQTQFPVSEDLPDIKEVIKKLITYTPLLVKVNCPTSKHSLSTLKLLWPSESQQISLESRRRSSGHQYTFPMTLQKPRESASRSYRLWPSA